jgi:ribosomal protein S18 acetylase RimI-like enzyme
MPIDTGNDSSVLDIRPASDGDAYDIVRINVAGWRDAYPGLVPDEVLSAMEVDSRVPRYRERMAQERDFETYVVGDGTALLGYLTCGPYRIDQRRDMLHPDVGEILAIYVDPPAQGRGAGRALMDSSLARLAERGFRQVRLWVLDGNSGACRFYERAGFRLDGSRSSYDVTRSDGRLAALPEVRYARMLS